MIVIAQEFIRGFSIIISSFLCFIARLKKTFRMAVSLTSPPPPPPAPFAGGGGGGGGGGLDSSKANIELRKRPARLMVPEYFPALEISLLDKKTKCMDDGDHKNQEFHEEVQGRDFFYLASKKGRRRGNMEDGYGVMLDVLGDPRQAFFAVIDGHGGRAAADYVAENLGKNIVKALDQLAIADDDHDDDDRVQHLVQEEEEEKLEAAIHGGYISTDKEFLSQGLNGGACAASVLLRNDHVHVANVGDCRVVLSRKGVAHVLTSDHRLTREDERARIENNGGFVHYRNGVWRVNGSLAVSRAIGDLHLKEWIISEPEIKKFPLNSDCEFLIMASDGLWDKVNDQEAVDVVLGEKNSIDSCKKLVDMSCWRGNFDDVTVMVIDVQQFLATATTG